MGQERNKKGGRRKRITFLERVVSGAYVVRVRAFQRKRKDLLVNLEDKR